MPRSESPDPSVSSQPAPLPSDPPAPRPRGALTFRQPTPESTTGPTTLPDDLTEPSPSPSDELPGEPSEPSAAPRTSSRASSADVATNGALRDAIRAGIIGAGHGIHTVLARDEAARTVGLYLTDEGDAEAIGDPLASIAQRHGGIGASGNPDLGDAISALIGLATYAFKQIQRWAAAREYRQALAQGHAPAPAEPQDV